MPSEEGIIDILQSVGDQCYTFTGNNAVNKVTLNAPVTPQHFMQNAEPAVQMKYFEPQDNLLIKSFHLRLPYAYILADDNIRIQLQWYDEADVLKSPLVEFSPSGFIWMITQCIEIPLSIFSPWPSPATNLTKLYLRCVVGTTISQIGAPDSLNDEILPVWVSFKILHTKPMVI